jgi:hypothetical protein
MLYAGYYNIKTATQNASAANSAATSANPSRRASSEKGAMATEAAAYVPQIASRRSSLRKALDFLSPYEQPLNAESMYGSRRSSTYDEEKRAKKEAKKAKARAERKTLVWNTERACYQQVNAA